MRRLKSKAPRFTATIENPFGIPCTIEVHPIDHPRSAAGRTEQAKQDLAAQLYQIRAESEERIRAKMGEDAPEEMTDSYLSLHDPEFLRRMRELGSQKEEEIAKIREEVAASLVRTWSGPAFAEDELPGNGFTPERVKQVMFECHGSEKDDDAPDYVVGRYLNKETGEFLGGDELSWIHATSECLKATMDEKADALMALRESGEEEMTDDEYAQRAVAIMTEGAAERAHVLAEHGVEEIPAKYRGKHIRRALAELIIDESREAQRASQRYRGFLAPTSASTPSSPLSSLTLGIVGSSTK